NPPPPSPFLYPHVLSLSIPHPPLQNYLGIQSRCELILYADAGEGNASYLSGVDQQQQRTRLCEWGHKGRTDKADEEIHRS
ncbi:hypothetical protein M378DRAFT_166462, partial [Amanita muscaria Koide BX008]